MLRTGGVRTFLFSCILATTPMTTHGAARAMSEPNWATPSSGVTIQAGVANACVALPDDTRADQPASLPAESNQAAASQPTTAKPVIASSEAVPADTVPAHVDRARSTLLTRVAGATGETVTRATPWYRTGMAGLGAVLGLIVLISYLARRYVPAVRAMGGGAVKVLQRTPLSSKQSIALVQVGRRMVLIGITPDRINSLSVIEDAEEIALLSSCVGKDARRSGAGFDKVLSAEAEKFSREPAETTIERGDGSKRLRDTRGQLEGMLQKLREMQAR